MVAATLGRPHWTTAGLAAAGAAICVAILFVGHLHLLTPGLLVAILAVLVGIAGCVILWQRRCLRHATELQHLQRAVIESSPNAVVMGESSGRIVAFNPAAERIFATPETSLARARISDLIDTGEGPPGTAKPLGRVLDAFSKPTPTAGRRLDGTTFPAEISVLRVGRGRKALFAAYVRDLTEQRKADEAHRAQQDRIHQSEKLNAMGSLLAGVAHELNNPLAILVTQATLLRDKAPTPDVERRAERIHAAAQRAGRIVKTFLAMARQKKPVRAPIDLNRVIEAAVELVGYGLRSAGIEVKLELRSDLPLVDADRDLMGQVFAATLINAQQALAERSGPRRIVIRTRAADGQVTAEIADNGCGIPDDIRDRIFEPYFTTKPVGAGTGIGLSMCRSILAAHDGRIDILPATDEGAAFSITLPAMATTGADEAEPAEHGSLSILVIDDETDVADSLAELLDVFGHRPVVVSSASEAIEHLKRQEFDAVITDLRMPGMSGRALHRAIRDVDPRLAERTVMMTGDTVMGLGREAHAGTGEAEIVLEKPFTAESVKAALNRVRDR